MTEKVNPSINRPGNAHESAVVIAEGGGFGPGWIVPSAAVYLADEDPDLNENDLNAFGKSGEAGLDVTIDGGEAFVHGAWLAIDTQTTVTLADDTADQTVYVGWQKATSNGAIVGLSADFNGNDRKIPLYDFTTAAGAVDSESDRRPVGKPVLVEDENDALVYQRSIGTQADPVPGTSHFDGLATGEISTELEDENDVTSSRSLNTTFQNTTGHDIIVRVRMITSGSSGNQTHNYSLGVAADAADASNFRNDGHILANYSDQHLYTLQERVPANYYYEVVTFSGNEATINDWFERGMTP